MKVRVRIDLEKCKGCALCVVACARKVLKLSEHMNTSGQQVVTVDQPDACIGCRRCTDMCPEAAIELDGEGPAAPARVHAETVASDR